MSCSYEWILSDLQFYLLHKVLNTGTISSKPIHKTLSPLLKHYCCLHSRNLHGSCTCKSKLSWHHHEESPKSKAEVRKKDTEDWYEEKSSHSICEMMWNSDHGSHIKTSLEGFQPFSCTQHIFSLMKKYLHPYDTEFLNCILRKAVVDLDLFSLPALDWHNDTKFFPYPITKEGNFVLKW